MGVIYFVGFNLVRLGVGDLVASGSGWGVVSVVASFGGLFVVTLSITYLVSVVSAVVSRRALAVRITSMGSSPNDIVAWAWDGTEFADGALQQLGSLAEPLLSTSERHLAFPIVEHFESAEMKTSAPLAVARLDEAMRLLEHAVAPDHRPARHAMTPLRVALDRYVEVVTRNAGDASTPASPPPPGQPEALGSLGIPVVDHARFGAAMDQRETERRAIAQHVRSAGWEWPDVAAASDSR